MNSSKNPAAIDSDLVFRREFQSSAWYKAVRSYFRAIAGIYHRELAIIGIENVPASGALMLIGNHPNTMLDLFNLLKTIQHPIAAAAKETITETPIIGQILRNKFFFIPLSRKTDQDENFEEEIRQAKNKEYLAEAKKLIQSGMIFTVYGEGVSNDNRKLNKIKMGFMAMAIDAEKDFDFSLNLQFVPFGYYYDKKNSFRSRVLVIFKPAYRLNQIYDLNTVIESLDQPEILNRHLKKMMLAGKNKMQSELEDIALSLFDPSLAEIIDPICELYSQTPHKFLGPYENIREKYYMIRKITQTILDIHHHQQTELLQIDQLIKEYRKLLKSKKIKDFTVANYYGKNRFAWYLTICILAIPLAPLSLVGYVLNLIPKYFGAAGRYFLVTRKNDSPVEGDMNAIIWGAVGSLLNYIPQGLAVAGLIFYSLFPYLGFFSIAVALLGSCSWVYIAVQFWKFSLKYNEFMQGSLKILFSHISFIFKKRNILDLKNLRREIIRKIDQILYTFSK